MIELTWFLLGEKFLPANANDNVDETGAESAPTDGAPMPQSEEEASLNEYYKNYYAQLYGKAAQDYQEQLKAYEKAIAAQKEQSKDAAKPIAPDDGYVIPKPQFETYEVTGKFAKVQGRFMADGQGGSEYWAGQGKQHDRQGRQLDHYFNVQEYQQAMAEGRVVANGPEKSKKRAKTLSSSKMPAFMAGDDPLEGAFRK